MSASTLAFLGDAVYGLLVRERLCSVNRHSGELHSMSVEYVSAAAQCRAYEVIKDILTESETAVFMRGRNFKTSSVPKHSSHAQYHTATGLETLFGYLYLTRNIERLNQLFLMIWQDKTQQ